MKRFITGLLFFLTTSLLMAEEYSFEVLGQFSNNSKAESLFRRSENQMDLYDDYTGNVMYISDEGEIYVQNIDQKRIYKINDGKLSLFLDYKKTDIHNSLKLVKVYDDGSALFTNKENYIKYVDKDANLIFSIDRYEYLQMESFDYIIYLQNNDVLFIWDVNGLLGCITDVTKAQGSVWKNYKNKDETLAIFNQQKNPDLYLDENNLIHYKEIIYPYKGRYVNQELYYTYTSVRSKRYVLKNETTDFDVYDYSGKEIVETMAVHPSGDLYFLRYNESTQIHTLYRIENTWDPAWRKQWYATHDTSSVSSTVKVSAKQTQSLNVAVNKSMTVKENLRLRSAEETSSNIITTMQGNTKVKVVELGKTETIDGITSAWVKVEIISGKNRDGKAINQGTTGWCFGGYLD